MGIYHPKYIVDTSLLIDLHVGTVLAHFFRLPYCFFAPDAIIAELQTLDGKELLKQGLQMSELTGTQILEVLQLKSKYSRPSVNDLFALVNARAFDAVLLTSDGNLRKAAKLEGVTTHGTLWILDEMVRLEILTTHKAREALQLMCEHGSRFPQDECEKRFRLWHDTIE